MLTPYCQKVLATELARSDYNGLTSDQAWAWLTQPTTLAPITRASDVTLTPVKVASVLGPAKAEAIAVALKQIFPTIADHLMQAGVDPTNPATQAFFAGLVTGNVITQDDANALIATGTVSVDQPIQPSRFASRFDPTKWPHVAIDGSPGSINDLAITGFPNSIIRDDFNAAWTLAGRN